MITGRWSELSEEHKVRYTGIERFLVITMTRTSGVTEGLYGLVVGESGQKIRQEFSSASARRSFPLLVLSLEFQSTCLALMSPAIRTGNPPPEQADRSSPISGREGER
jgi:hypothetical protein